ncbi:MAG: glycosyltransferase family 4 protein [Actinobacteria bacterium]|jgi:glycosyltransferase involved in cell wall biosynthesis|nr:glycosyltransferase family 4 protein [Actinomycetota bacterium]
MRIGIIAPPWTPVPPALYGGIELVVDQLARGFVAAGHSVTLFTTGDSTCPVPKKWILDTAEGKRLGMAVPELRHVMHAYEALGHQDIIHDHTVIGPVMQELHRGVPVVTTIHGPFNDELTDIYSRIADKVPIIAISNAQRNSAPNVPVATVIHHGIEASDFPMGDGSGGYLLFLGRMSPEKGAHRAIRVARQAGMPLYMAAKMREAWEIQYFKEQVEPLLGDDAQYLGEVPHSQKLELLAGAVGLLFPIRWNEPFGMVMLEALACGTPVIAFPEGSVPEVIEDGKTGFICDNEEEMVAAVHKLGDIDRQTCRQTTETRLSASRMVQDHLKLFDALVTKHQP